MSAEKLKEALAACATPARAAASQRFFKTGKGQYGEGDEFIGVSMPDCRSVCRQFKDLPLPDVQKLLNSPVHEHRMAGVIILANQYQKSDDRLKNDIYELYLKNVYGGQINNWDLVDVTAEHVMGAHLLNRPRGLLYELAKSKDLWQKRVSIMTSFGFIKKGQATTTLDLAEILLDDRHDLIQKAVGWMLREIGKRVDQGLLLRFLDQHAHSMPRTTLRYAIEHLNPEQRVHYMGLKAENT